MITILLPTTTTRFFQAGLPGEFAWAICAAISLSSSKYLLVELGLHYPFRLHVFQLGTTLAVQLLSFTVSAYHSKGILQKTIMKGTNLCAWTVAGFAAASGILTLQALLHFPNLATVAMIPMLGYGTEQVLNWTYTLGRSDPQRPSSSLIVLCFCCGGLLLAEYRLTRAGLACILPAILSIGIARSLQGNSESLAGRTIEPRVYRTLSYLCGLVISASCTLVLERDFPVITNLNGWQTALLALNVASSATTLHRGESFLMPSAAVSHRGSLLATLVLTGCTGCIAVLLLQRSYTGISQLGSYSVAMIALSYPTEKTAIHLPMESVHNACLLPRQRMGELPSPLAADATTVAACAARRLYTRAASRLLHKCLWVLFLFIVTIAWAVFLVLNLTPRLFSAAQRTTPLLDLDFQPNRTSEVVISLYNESLIDVASLIASLQAIPALSNPHIHIYTKAPMANTTAIQQHTGAHQVTRLPNVGREGETYLHHILGSWGSLARHTLFIQANVHNQREFLLRIKSYFDPQRTGMLSLGFVGHTSSCRGPDVWGWTDDSGMVDNVYSQIYQQPCRQVLLSYKGQFIVSAERIRGIPKSIYGNLHRALVDKSSWAHQEPYLQGRVDIASAPIFGYTLERLWNTIFQCSDSEVAWQCPSLLSGSREGGSQSDCQCFDR